MPAPKRPNTAAATEAVRRRGQRTMAKRLREAGWVTVPPEDVDWLTRQGEAEILGYVRTLIELANTPE